MITIVYHVEVDMQATELEWLRSQKIFPAYEQQYDWNLNKSVIKIGVIVSSEQALAVKLRHKLDKQEDYRQR